LNFDDAHIPFVFDPVPQPATPNLKALELMHQYETMTASTCALANHGVMLQAWEHDMPLAAQSHDFLMHGILGLSALHKAHLCPHTRSDYYNLALKYQAKASVGFRSAVEQVNARNSTAVFGFSLIIAVSQFNHCVATEPLTPKQGLEAMLDAFTAIRGSHAIATQFITLVDETSFRVLPIRARNLSTSPLDENVQRALNALGEINLLSGALGEEKAICTCTLQELRQWYSVVSPYPKSWKLILKWPMIISSEFFVLLKQGHPMALLILAHWCVPMHRLTPRWFVNGWAERAVRIIASMLPVAWRDAMSWPMKEMNLRQSDSEPPEGCRYRPV
jgi:hypothetical protein